ncbi:hypothetical protein IPM65_04865 [Candidatus Roizmanbacteria bacterium]|nr:MAG: hypothetical protein IPM65_04865 [Candidatus Roizmanbacteria bacterium]
MSTALQEQDIQITSELASHDRAYFNGLDVQRRDHQHKHVKIGENFIPSSLMTESERAQVLGVVPYELLKGQDYYLHAAQGVHVRFHPMDAGLGSSVIRDDYLQEMSDVVDRKALHGKKGSKSTDLYLPYMQADGSIGYMSIAEVKINRIIAEAGRYGGISLTPIVNDDSHPAMAAVYDQYEPYFQEHNILNGRWLKQGDLPSWDVAAGRFSTEHVAPGGHGQAGVMLLHEIMSAEDQGVPTVRSIFNGDGPNNFVTPEMVAYTSEEAGIVMITTTRTPADVKGGIIGGKVHGDGSMTPDICELAQAKKAGQTDLFMQLGLAQDIQGETIPSDRTHASGEQYFNTNTALMNETVLRPFLHALRDQMTAEAFDALLTPELMLNTKEKNGKKFDQLEGALGSLILRLNEAVQNNEFIGGIWQEVSGGKAFLKIINTNPQDRDETFTPNKFPVDFLVQSSSDHFLLNTDTWMLENRRPGHIPRMEGDLVQKGYYADVQNVRRTFGRAAIRGLDMLHMEGAFICPDAVWRGNVRLKSHLNTPVELTGADFKNFLGQNGDEPLVLENIDLEVFENGRVLMRNRQKQAGQKQD